MRKHPPHIDTTSIKVDDGDQSVPVARDIKDGKFADLVRTVIERPYVREPLPVSLSGHLIPGPQ
jgi:hypothetical protein